MKKLFWTAVMVVVIASPVRASTPGFRHAQNGSRVSITVERLPQGNMKQALKLGMKYWNDLAGWKLLTFGDDPEISYEPFSEGCPPPGTSCALPTEGTDGYVSCQFYMDPGDGNFTPKQFAPTMSHELGHCLGFAHQTQGIMWHPEMGPYPGKNKNYDRSLLVGLGYR